MKRVFSLLLSLIIALLPVCTAFADFSLPSALTAIESEAFSSMPISGNVTLPDGVQSIGDRAFANTDVFSMAMPSGLVTIGDGILEGTDAVYVTIPSADTSLSGSSLGAKYIIGEAGSNAQSWANANGVAFIDAANVVKQDGFVYSYVESSAEDTDGLPSGYYLMFPENQGISGSVTVPQTVNGQPVVFISRYAFTQLSGVTEINLPDSAEMPAAQIGWPDAAINTYSTSPEFDVWVIANEFSMPLGAIAIPQWGVNAGEELGFDGACTITVDHPEVLSLFVKDTGDWFSARAIGTGTAVITITAQCGELTDTETITINVAGEAAAPSIEGATEVQGEYEEKTVVVGEQFPLIISDVLPEIETWYTLQPLSDNEEIIATEGEGFTAVAPGETDIYNVFTYANGDTYYAKAHITVTEAEYLDVWVNDDAFDMPLSAIAIPQWGVNAGEELGFDGACTITVDHPEVLSLFVKDTGDWFSARAIGTGTAIITITAQCGELTDTETITINVAGEAAAPSIEGATEVQGEYEEKTVVVGEQFPLIISDVLPEIETWYTLQPLSDNEEIIATEGEGFTAVAPGETDIYNVFTYANGDTYYAKAHITSVEAGVPEGSVEVALNHETLAVNPGDVIEVWLEEELAGEGWNEWQFLSTDEGVVVCREHGVYEVVGTGSAILTVLVSYESGEQYYGRVRVTSAEPSLDVFFYEDSVRIPVGVTIYAPWDATFSSDLVNYEEMGALDHFTSDDTVLQLEEDETGVPATITGLKAGVVDYTIEGEVRGAYDSATIAVEVYEPEIAMNMYALHGYTGHMYQLTIEEEIPEDAAVAFVSSDESVAQVDADGVITLIDPTEDWNAETFEAEITCIINYADGTSKSAVCELDILEWQFDFRDVDALDITASDDMFVWPMLQTGFWSDHRGSYTLESISHNTDILTFGEATHTIDAVPQATLHGFGTTDVTFKASFNVPDGTPCEGTVTSIEMTIPVTVNEPWLEAYIETDDTELRAIGDYFHTNFWWEGDVEPINQYLTSSDESVVTVSSEGVVRAVGSGEATITYTVEWKCGLKRSAALDVRVLGSSVTLNATEITIKKGETFTLVPYMDVPEGAEIDTHFWSTNEGVASVSWNGVVTGLSAGTTAVLYDGRIGEYEARATCLVTVVDDAAKITLNETFVQLQQGGVFEIVPTFSSSNVEDITYESSDEGTVFVSENGVVTMIGDTQDQSHYPYITVSATVDGERVSAYCTVRSYTPAVYVRDLEGGIMMDVGGEHYPWYQVVTDGADVAYKMAFFSDNEEVLKAEADGKIIAVGAGTANLTVAAVTDDENEDVISQRSVTVYVETWYPLPESISLSRTHYLVETDEGRQPYTYTGVQLVPDEAWVYWGVQYTVENPEIAAIGEHGFIHGLSEGTTTFTATVTYEEPDENGELVQKTMSASADITVANLRVVADKEVYAPGDIATLTIEGFPEDIAYEWINWNFPYGVNECTPVMHDQSMSVPTIQVRVNQPGNYWFNADVRIDDAYHNNFDCEIYCEGDWNDYVLNRNDVYMAVGDSTWVGPEHDSFEAIRSESSNTDVVTIAEDDICWLTAVGAGEADVTFYFLRWDDEAQMEVEDSRTAHITVAEPVWGVYDWDQAPSVMQLGREYWCGVGYWYNGIDFEQHETLTISNELLSDGTEGDVAYLHEDDHITVIPAATGTFTLTVDIEIGGKTYTQSKEILVVEPDVYTKYDYVQLSPRDTFTMNLITANGAEIESVQWASSDESKAVVDENGLVTVYGSNGMAVITADVTLVGGAAVSVSYIIEIVHDGIAGMEVNNPYLTVNPGEWFDVWFNEELPDTDGGQDWQWESSDESVIVSHGDGMFEVVGLGKANAMLTVTYESGERFYGVARINSVEAVVDVFFNEESISIPVGTTYFPDWGFEVSTDLFEHGFDFYTDNEEVLKVECDEMHRTMWITALQPGTANLSIYGRHYGDVEDTATITVEVYEQDVALNHSSIWGYTGFTYQLNVEEELSEGAQVSFASSNEEIASVDENGLITVHAREYTDYEEFEVGITCTVTEADGSSREALCRMNILPWLFGFNEDVGELGIRVGTTDYVWNRLITAWWTHHATCYTLKSVSADESILSFAEETHTIDAVPDATAHQVSEEGFVNVTFCASFNPPDGTPMEGTQTSIERTVPVYIYEPYMEAFVGEEYYEFESVGDSNHLDFWSERECELERQTLTSSDPSVVTISADGEMRAVGVGSATVTYTIEAYGIVRSASAEVYVRGGGVTLNETEVTVNVGETFYLAPTMNVPEGAEIDTHFYSSNNDIAYAEWNGMVTGIAAGRTVVNFNCRVWGDGYEYYERAQCVVNVEEPDAKITLNATYLELKEGNSFMLIPTFSGTATDVTFTSNDEEHVSVTQDGLVTLLQGTGGYEHYPSVCVSATVDGVAAKVYCTVRSYVPEVYFRGYDGHVRMNAGSSGHTIWYEIVTTNPEIAYKVTYASDNTAVVTVDAETGVLTAVSAGVANITLSIVSEDENGVVYDQYTIPVYVDEDIPEPTGIVFEDEIYYVCVDGYGESTRWLNAWLTPDEMWRYYGDDQIEYALTAGSEFAELNDRELHALSMGEAEITASFTYEDANGDEQTVQASVPVMVLQPELVADKDVYQPGDIATLTLEGIPESVEVAEINWDYWHDVNGLTLVEQDGATIKLRVNQPIDGSYWVNVNGRFEGDWHFDYGVEIFCEGDWNHYTLNETDVTAAVGENFWIGPNFGTDGITSVSSNTDVIVIDEYDPCNLTAVGTGEATVTYTCTVWENDQQVEIVRSVNIKVVEPQVEIYDWENVPNAMLVGNYYWCGPNYWYSGRNGIEQYATLTIDNTDVAQISEYDHMSVKAVAPGVFTLTLTIDADFMEAPYTVSKQVYVVQPDVYPEHDSVELRPGVEFTMNLITAEGVEITSQQWSTSDATIASVDSETGLVTVNAEDGSAVITASLTLSDGRSTAVSYLVNIIPDHEVWHEWDGYNDHIHLNVAEWGDYETSAWLGINFRTNADASEINIEWYADDDTLFTVDEEENDWVVNQFDKTIHAVKAGSTAYYCHVWVDGIFDETFTFSVNIYEPTAIITPEQEEYVLEVGQSVYVNWNDTFDHCGAISSEVLMSSDDLIALTDVHGNIAGSHVGEATVTRRVFIEGHMAAEASVKVIVQGVSMALNEDQLTLAVGQTHQLDLTVNSTYDDLVVNGYGLRSSDENVAVVDENGLIRAVGAGSAVIRFEAYTNYSSPYGELVVAVTEDEAADFAITAAYTEEDAAVLGYSTASKFFSNMNYQFSHDFSGAADSVTWSIHSIDGVNAWMDENGLLSIGDISWIQYAVVTCEVTSGENVYSASYPMQLNPSNIRIMNWNMSDDPGAWRYMNAGDGDYIDEAIAIADPDIAVMHTWASSDENIVTVDQDGNVYAVDQGQADVTLAAWTGDGEVRISHMHYCVEVENLATSMTTWCDPYIQHVEWGRFGSPMVIEPLYASCEIEYTGFDTEILQLDEDMQFTPLKTGRTTVTVIEHKSGLTVSWDVLIIDNSIQLAEENGRTTFTPGETVQLVFAGENVWNEGEIDWIDYYRHGFPDGIIEIDENNRMTILTQEDQESVTVFATVGFPGGNERVYEFTFSVDAVEAE